MSLLKSTPSDKLSTKPSQVSLIHLELSGNHNPHESSPLQQASLMCMYSL